MKAFIQDEMLICAINHDDYTVTINLPLWQLGKMQGSLKNYPSNESFSIIEGKLSLTLAAKSSMILI